MCGGTVAGKVARLRARSVSVGTAAGVFDPEAEVETARRAIARVQRDLVGLSELAGGVAADILIAQAAMASDPVLGENIDDLIRSGIPAAQAVNKALAAFEAELNAAGGRIAERSTDLEDIGKRIISIVLGSPLSALPDLDEPYVLVAKDLSPADTAVLDPTMVLAIVTEGGTPTSHMAIIARSLLVPTVVACPDAGELPEGISVIVDGASGAVTVDPTPDEVKAMVAGSKSGRSVHRVASGPGLLADGNRIQLLANVAGVEDIEKVKEADCEGIGLFRTEFLFFGRNEPPGVEEQAAIYRRLFESFGGRKVIIRTLDAGADKPVPFADLGHESNPALGVRGYRMVRRHPELLDTQLKAIARAATDLEADVWVMAPMISTPGEANDFAVRAKEVGLAVTGVMIEVPAAAVRAKSLLSYVDFASIGTNDLSQYAFAADREAASLAEMLDPWQPGLLELIKIAGEAGRVAGKEIGVCGESASDPQLAVVLVGLGISSLSMSPSSLGGVRAELALRSHEECVRAAEIALAEEDPLGARNAVQNFLVRTHG